MAYQKNLDQGMKALRNKVLFGGLRRTFFDESKEIKELEQYHALSGRVLAQSLVDIRLVVVGVPCMERQHLLDPVRSNAPSQNFQHRISHPSQAPHFLSDASPVWASGKTALSLYEPLEVHDPFNSSSQWLEPCYVGTAVLLVLALAFLRTIISNRGFPLGKNQASQARKTSDIEELVPDSVAGQQLTEIMGFPIC